MKARRTRGQNAVQIYFFSACIFRCGWYKQQNTKTIQASKGSEGPDANTFELLIPKHDRAYMNVESEESIYVIMKYNTVIRDGL